MCLVRCTWRYAFETKTNLTKKSSLGARGRAPTRRRRERMKGAISGCSAREAYAALLDSSACTASINIGLLATSCATAAPQEVSRQKKSKTEGNDASVV